ncbi:hypothetical protein TMO_3443 [Tistrella mobilis KA081020-065]|uniref:Uncharacterized protein n=1 Tax=Tistrella mobilis (strain KA081020-065) TaxID=1110502 RepID=I3TR93_TISMK|nr:hypothetical protein TMO_3443 [Tistrella mobilis KA081020-065]
MRNRPFIDGGDDVSWSILQVARRPGGFKFAAPMPDIS